MLVRLTRTLHDGLHESRTRVGSKILRDIRLATLAPP